MSDLEAPGPLQLSTMDEIIDEIGRRHTGCIVIAEALRAKKSEDRSDRHVAWRGGWTLAVGLMRYASMHFDEMVRRSVSRAEDEDERLRGGDDDRR